MQVIKLNREDQMQMELMEKSKWVRNVLLKMGFPTNEWNEILSMDELRKLRVVLKKMNIEIIDDSDNGIEIYYDDNLVAEWRRPFYILKENIKEKNSKNRYYLEMQLKCRSVFDDK